MKSAHFYALLIFIITSVETQTLNEINEYLYSSEYTFLNESDCKETYQQFFELETYTEENCNGECGSNFKQLNCISEDELVYFPKCCPPNYLYETTEHKCVKTDINETVFDYLGFKVSLLKSGLENCRVIVDYIVQKNDFVQQEVIRIGSGRGLFYQERNYYYGRYCFDKIVDADDFVVRLCHEEEFCQRRMKGDPKGVRCIKKCCPDGQMFVGRTCGPRPGHGLPASSQGNTINNASGNFAVFISDLPQKYVADKKKYKYHIDEEGTLFLNVSNKIQEYTIDEQMYCIESVSTMGDGIFFLQPRKDFKQNINFQISRAVLIISCVFLVLTLLAFALIKELQNFLGKVLVCYCISLLVGFATTVAMLFNSTLGYHCVVAGYVITFSFLAAFTWATLISYDIWSVLGSMKTQYGNSKRKEIKKFLLYNLLGWSVPGLITGFMALDNKHWILPDSVHPYVGRTTCLVEKHREGNYGYSLYITGPCGVLILINVIIYVKTITYILKVKKEIDRIKNKGSEEKHHKMRILAIDKERVTMVLKLFLVMGLNWIFDAIASIIDFKQNSALQVIEIIFDVFNGLQGVLIFCIFVMKRKIFLAFARKLGFKTRHFGTSSEVTNRTVIESIRK